MSDVLTEIRDIVSEIRAGRPIDPDEPMKKAQACAYAKVSPKTIERWMKAGLRHYPGPLFTKRDINQFLASIAIEPHRLRRAV